MSDTDLSSLAPRPYTELPTVQLPTRGEKRLIPTIFTLDPSISIDDFSLRAALSPYDQYVLVRIPGRGIDSQGNPDRTASAYYTFLINPSEISVSRQTIDQQANARAGWQFGVWGEGLITISMHGRTPGKYFSNGLTDMMSEYTQSYRNLAALEAVFENNGYWFEGEQVAEGPLASDYSRRRIKVHQTIQLVVGEFIWEGYFESMSVTENASDPYLSEFALSFTCWREKFRNNTPYQNSTGWSIERGHTTGPIPLVTTTSSFETKVPGNPAPTTPPPNVSTASPALNFPFPAQPFPNLPPRVWPPEIDLLEGGGS
jgi:hypothetical protein